VVLERLIGGTFARLPHVQRPRYRGCHEGGIGDVGERDEEDATLELVQDLGRDL
jgi:hypothetical protein